MKRKYTTPCAKLVDFNYDEQVAATSIPCMDYDLWDFIEKGNCHDLLLGQAKTRAIHLIGCHMYTDGT